MKSNKAQSRFLYGMLLLITFVTLAAFTWVLLQPLLENITGVIKATGGQQSQHNLVKVELADYGLECDNASVSNITFFVFNGGTVKLQITGMSVGGANVSAEDLKAPANLNPGNLGALKITNAQKYASGLAQNTQMTKKIAVYANGGLLESTIELHGSRCQ